MSNNSSRIISGPKRAVAPYFGGKWRLAPWVLSHFPDHTTYLECFGGAASCLLRKPRVKREIYNDLSGEMCGLFRVLRDPVQSQRLIEQIELTPYARTEYVQSYTAHHEAVEQARRTLFRLHSAFGGDCQQGRMTGFKTGRGDKDPQSWARFPAQLGDVVARFQGVLIEQRPALDVIRLYDDPDALIYCDPPYLPSTRASSSVYRHEMTEQEHHDLATALHGAKGMVVLSGYPSELYRELYAGWQCETTQARALSHGLRTEALWLNPAASNALQLTASQALKQDA